MKQYYLFQEEVQRIIEFFFIPVIGSILIAITLELLLTTKGIVWMLGFSGSTFICIVAMWCLVMIDGKSKEMLALSILAAVTITLIAIFLFITNLIVIITPITELITGMIITNPIFFIGGIIAYPAAAGLTTIVSYRVYLRTL